MPSAWDGVLCQKAILLDKMARKISLCQQESNGSLPSKQNTLARRSSAGFQRKICTDGTAVYWKNGGRWSFWKSFPIAFCLTKVGKLGANYWFSGVSSQEVFLEIGEKSWPPIRPAHGRKLPILSISNWLLFH